MKLRIVTEKPGWILHRLAMEIQRILPDTRINRGWRKADIHYYINYGYYRGEKVAGLKVGCFTHYDPDHLGEQFKSAAEEMDHCVAISRQTAEILYDLGIPDDKVTTIIIGADDAYKPEVTLGIVGRTYPGGRKGEKLVQALLEDAELMDGLAIITNNPGWGVPQIKTDNLREFYRMLDYLLVPSLIEGGPVPFMEALACGVEAIAPEVGVIPDFPHINYKKGDVDSLKQVIMRVKQPLLEKRGKLAAAISQYNWGYWANSHKELFESLLQKKRV